MLYEAKNKERRADIIKKKRETRGRKMKATQTRLGEKK